METIISLRVIDIDSETVDIKLVNEGNIWKKKDDEYPTGIDYSLEIKTNENKIVSIHKGAKIESSTDEIYQLFSDVLLSIRVSNLESEYDGIEMNDETSGEILEIEPYDPMKIRVDTKPFSVEYVCKLIEKGRLDISPAFQRGFVWTEITRKSRLIESIMLRIPLPLFYLSQDEDGNYQVVDGVQRLTVINDFINNRFKLKNLEYLTELNNKWFNRKDKDKDESIPLLYSGRIEDTQLFFNIIDSSTPERVKYDIFRRINTGGVSLNSQEIRNCLSTKETRKMLEEMVKLDSFKKSTNNSVRSTRMADRELALRFAGFYMLDEKLIDIEYRGDMDWFLDRVTDSLNKQPEAVKERIISQFDISLTNAYLLFNSRAFRKTTQINKSLFLSWTRLLRRYSTSEIEIIDNNIIKEKLKSRIEVDATYYYAITYATNDALNIQRAYNVAKEILEECLNES